MDKGVIFNALDYQLQVGEISISVPDHSSKEYSIFTDLADFFGVETNNEAQKMLTVKVKDEGIRGKLHFDAESDFVGIYSRNGKAILKVAVLLNKLMKEDFNLLNIQEYEQFIDSWKRPKKQKWGIGDIFSIKLPSGTYFFGQIVELNEGVAPICLIFDLNSKHMPSTQEIYDAEIITAVWINSYYFDDYTFNVLFRMEIIGEVGSTNRRDPVRNVTWSTSSLEEFCMNYQLEWKSEVIENMLYNRHFVRRRKCMIE